MPKITFTENDLTGARYLGDDIIVFVPGTSSIATDNLDTNSCILLNSLADLDEGKPGKALESNPFVYNILKNNFKVLYHQYDSTKVIDSNFLTYFNFLKDKNSYDIKFITLGCLTDNFIKLNFGENNLSLPEILTALASICAIRQDCTLLTTALLDTGVTESDLKSVLDKLTIDNSSYIGLFISNDFTYSASVKREDILDPVLAYIINFSKAMLAGKKWDAIAGINRGVVKDYFKGSVASKYKMDTNVFEDTKMDYSFNAVCDVRPYGPTIWGDRTLYKNTGELKASSFLSIRNMVCDIVKRTYNAAINNTYETNNEITWSNFKGTITDLLDQMVAGYNLADYKVIKVPSTKRATIECQIHITPIEPVEDFDIYIQLNNIETNIDPRLE